MVIDRGGFSVYTCKRMNNQRRMFLKGACAAIATAVVALGIYSLHISSYQIEPRDNQPVFHARAGQGWSRQHPPAQPPPTGLSAIGSIGSSQALYVDASQGAGLRYRWQVEGPHPLDILQTIGNGCAFLDYNNDGNLDILLVGNRIALYEGNGHGHFKDATQEAGLGNLKGQFLGVAVGDYDSDGFDDLYISGYKTGVLLHNENGHRFTDGSKASGVPQQPWGTSCTWFEAQGNGKLDLYVGNYVMFDPRSSIRLCPDREHMSACTPLEYKELHGRLYINKGRGVFRDESDRWHSDGAGKCLGVAAADYDMSGHQSLYLANDEMPGNLLKNSGSAFRDVGRESGTAFDGHVKIHGGMGLDWGDYDHDGLLDLLVAAFYTEPKCVFHNDGNGLFEDFSDKLTLTQSTYPFVAFGCKWLDYDNDGWLDLMIANGHVQDNISEIDKTASYEEPTQLFRNDRARLFVDMSQRAGPALKEKIIGRGLAIGDYDNDGRMDALVVNSNGSPLLLHNESSHVGNFLTFTLKGTKSNSDGYGAVVTVKYSGTHQILLCHADGSYLSSSDKRVHVGLGSAKSASLVEVRWPSGHIDTYHNVEGNRFYTIGEGALTLTQSEHRAQ